MSPPVVTNPAKDACPFVLIVTPVPTKTLSLNVETPAILTLSKFV